MPVIFVCFATLVLAGCGAPSLFSNRAGDFVAGFESAVAGDEPQSVLVAEQVLAADGSAADAVVAAYFAMSVALPSAASLGGGGVCLVNDATKRDEKDKEPHPPIQALVFTHDPDTKIPAPANVRGMLALHAKYGQLSWQRLLAPAESMARFGITVSKAMASHLKAQSTRIQRAPGLRLIFAQPGGDLVREGERLRQIDLSITLSSIRRAPGRFIRGDGAERLAAAYRQTGVEMTAAQIEAQTPVWAAPVNVVAGSEAASFPPTPAGVAAAEMWAALYGEGLWRGAGDENKPHAVAEVTRRVFAKSGALFYDAKRILPSAQARVAEDRIEKLMAGYDEDKRMSAKAGTAKGRPPVADMGSASIVAADRYGMAVACSFTLNRPMGAARLVPRTGIVMAAAPDYPNQGAPVLGLMLLRLESVNQLQYIGAATGGWAAPTALVTSALEMLEEDTNLETAQRKVRLFSDVATDQVAVEQGPEGEAIAKRLRAKGHQVTLVPPMGRLNAFICPRGFEGPESRCEVRTDPRAAGFAVGK